MLSSSYLERAKKSRQPLARRILQLMGEKETNLAFSADLRSKAHLLELVEIVGPHICVLKTHLDIIDDYEASLPQALSALAEKHHFIILEDRKFADIGSTVQDQYGGGLLRIADWADLVTVHGLPGSGIVQGLKEVGLPKGRACLLLAEMSSSGHLLSPEYRNSVTRMAEEHSDFVIGFIAQRRLAAQSDFLYFSPGIGLNESADALGQNYTDPRIAIKERGSDVVIVGRHIYKASDPLQLAKHYRDCAWQAYQERLS